MKKNDLKSAQAALTKAKIQQSKLRVDIEELEDVVEREVNLPKARALVGQVFKARTNYSCPKGPEDYWWVFRRITTAHLNESGLTELVYDEIQIDCRGELLTRQNQVTGLNGMQYWQKSSFRAWLQEVDRARNILRALIQIEEKTNVSISST